MPFLCFKQGDMAVDKRR